MLVLLSYAEKYLSSAINQNPFFRIFTNFSSTFINIRVDGAL